MRLIDADALPKLLDAEYKQTMKLICGGEKHLDNLAEGFAEASRIARYIAPTVDAVPVVRCKDCKWNRPDILLDKHWCSCFFVEVRADGFCSLGERRESCD